MLNKLDENTIKRIAAGEIYNYPRNVVKELLDNSIDGECTNIKIGLKTGGYGVIRVADDGKGILGNEKENLCERFSTSKISCHEDLSSLRTLGFRGEALACLSFTSDLEICSVHASEVPKGFRAKYKDGKLVDWSPIILKASGTIVEVFNLFRHHPQRRRVNEASQERGHILDIITDYCLHYPHVAFSVSDLNNTSQAALLLTQGKTNNHLHTMSQLFNNDHVIKIEASDTLYDLLAFASPLTQPTYSNLPSRFTTFVNDRLVQWPTFRRAIRLLYNESNPKERQVFFYASLHLPPSIIDPNVDPTKTTFLCKDENKIIQILTQTIKEELVNIPAEKTLGQSSILTKKRVKEPLFVLDSDGGLPGDFWNLAKVIGSVSFGVFVLDYRRNLIIADIHETLKEMIGRAVSEGIPDKLGLVRVAELHPMIDTKGVIGECKSEEGWVAMEGGRLRRVPFLFCDPDVVSWLEYLSGIRGRIEDVLWENESKSWSSSVSMRRGSDEHIWAAIRRRLAASEGLKSSGISVRQVSDLPNLLSAFERC